MSALSESFSSSGSRNNGTGSSLLIGRNSGDDNFQQQQQHQQQQQKQKGVRRLTDLCRAVVVASLERFPAEALSILDEYEWDSIIRMKHKNTKPQKGQGGLDGTGRRTPAITEKFLLEVEETNPHLEQSQIADQLVWKDIIEFRFKKGGLSRPKILLYPWPVLVQSLKDSGRALTECVQHTTPTEGNSTTIATRVDERTKYSLLRAMECIEESPMDLCLLKESGIGKVLKKFLAKSKTIPALTFLDEPFHSAGTKKSPPRTTLEAAMQSWITMAETSGVQMNPGSVVVKKSSNRSTEDDLSDMKSCQMWRELYRKLKTHDEDRRSRHGEKMRERKQRLDSVRPKIVKVRHATTKHTAILDRASGGNNSASRQSTPQGNSKIQQLKMEAHVTSTRRHPPRSAISPEAAKPRSSFGASVAFAAVGKTVSTKRKTAPITKSVAIAGGKRMLVPGIASQGNENLKKRLKMLKKGQSTFRP
jgi:hypothetical protein